MDPLGPLGVGFCMGWLVAGLAGDGGASRDVFGGGIGAEAGMRIGKESK